MKGVILLASIVTLFGVVRLFTGSRPPELAEKRTVERPQNTTVERSAASVPPVQPTAPANTIEDRTPRTLAAMPANSTGKMPVETAEAVYICGAATKKGTPCSRKVKGNVRCWQHLGQPAMLPAEQLRVGR